MTRVAAPLLLKCRSKPAQPGCPALLVQRTARRDSATTAPRGDTARRHARPDRIAHRVIEMAILQRNFCIF
jgi:hypothetical protein